MGAVCDPDSCYRKQPRAYPGVVYQWKKLEASPLKILERDVKRGIADYLRLRGFRIRVRTVGGAYRLRLGGGDQYIPWGESGMADLCGWHIGTGRAIEVEAKKPGAKTSPKRQAAQQRWLDDAKRDGVIAFRASSVQEADEQLTEYGFPRRLLV